jgi:RNA 2',3'-cyclic 3'-phosphodiesterase
MTRTFIALEMNEGIQRQLVEVIRQLALNLPSVRWVDPTGIHLTLAFLGELDDKQLLDAIQASVSVAQHVQPFHYTLTRLSIFGPRHQPRVIWMGIEEATAALSRLHHVLNQELTQRGFRIDNKPFSPHLTLARIKAPLSLKEQDYLQEMLSDDLHSLVSAQVYPVTSIQVIKSELLRAGAHYTNLRTCKFGEQLKNESV